MQSFFVAARNFPHSAFYSCLLGTYMIIHISMDQDVFVSIYCDV
jgi:hypothetical protein